MAMEIIPLGDAALIVRTGNSLGAVLRTWSKLTTARLPGVVEVAPAWASVTVFFDSPRDLDACVQEVQTALKKRGKLALRPIRPRIIKVPVCYDREFALDLDQVATTNNLTPGEVIKRHAAAHYRVRCLGFTAGFPYLSGLPARLATARRSTPRLRVPAGSVAIGGDQTGIYPLPSPGGWNIVGRTPLRIFDPARENPATLRPGDRLRFIPIDREEFEKWDK
ncbi:MAG: 5-oxoprolinase subunit PxpB [Chthoniobacterales bacterium]